MHLAIVIGIYATLAQGLNLLLGYTGIISVMQASLYGVGAYISALMASQAGVSFPLAFASASIGAALTGFIVGAAITRLQGDYLALVTFGLAVIFYDVFNNWLTVTKGPMGIPGIPAAFETKEAWLVFVAALAVAALLLVRRIDGSPYGRLLRAVRDDEILASVLGRSTQRTKTTVFTLSAFLAGAAGSVYAHYITFIDPTSFTAMESVSLLTMVIIGGMASPVGPILGAGFVVLVAESLRFAGLPDATAAPLRQVLFGLLIIVAMLFRPQGLMGRYRLSK